MNIEPQKILPASSEPFTVLAYNNERAFVSLREGIAQIILGPQGWEVQETTPLSAEPYGLALSPDRLILAAACQDGIHVGRVIFLDAASLQVLSQVTMTSEPISPGVKTIEVTFSLDGAYAFATNEAAGTVSIIKVNNGTNILPCGYVKVDALPVGLVADSNYVYVVSEEGTLQVIDIQKAVNYAGASAVISSVSAGKEPVRVTLSTNDGKDYVWVTVRGGDKVITFDKNALVTDPNNAQIAAVQLRQAFVAITDVGIAPVGMQIFDNNRRLAVANSNRFEEGRPGSMTILDTNAIISGNGNAVVETVDVHLFPREFGLTPDENTLFLTNFDSDEVMIFTSEQFS